MILTILFTFLFQTNLLHQPVQVLIPFKSVNDLTPITKAGIPLDHMGTRRTSNGYEAVVYLTEEETRILEKNGIAFRVGKKIHSTQNKMALTEAKQQWPDFRFGSMGGFYTTEEAFFLIDSIQAAYPHLMSVRESIGKSVEGRDIWMVRLSDNPEFDEDEPEVLITALHHAREPQSLTSVIDLLEEFTRLYGTDPEITRLLDEREIYVVPIVNPDGYLFNETSSPDGGGMWRKNRRVFTGGTGVDLNRNYGYQWGFDDEGSSPVVSSNVYRGPEAFSEPETRTIRDLYFLHEFQTAIHYHSFGNLFIYPWGFKRSFLTPDSSRFIELGKLATAENGFSPGTGDQTVGYITNGDALDWSYGEPLLSSPVFAVTPEIGSAEDGFWPEPSRIPVLTSYTRKINRTMIAAAGDYPVVTAGPLTGPFDNLPFKPGYLVEPNISIRNLGSLATNSPVSVKVNLNDVFSEPVVFQGILGKMESQTIQLPLNISSDLKPGTKIIPQLILEYKGTESINTTDPVWIGVPVSLFSDGFENGNENWVIESNWGITSSFASEGVNSLTDSPSGNYLDDAIGFVRLKNPVSLPDNQVSVLLFDTRFTIEPSYDAGIIELSEDGVNWHAMQGEFTKPGSGFGVQPEETPLFDGTQTEWVREAIDLSDFAGKSVYFRFRFQSDSFARLDGWYIDHVRVLSYPEETGTTVENSVSPESFQLGEPYPNPFNPTVILPVSVSKSGPLTLEVFDVTGRLVTSFVRFTEQPGWQYVSIHANDWPSGIYLVKVSTQSGTGSKRITLLK